MRLSAVLLFSLAGTLIAETPGTNTKFSFTAPPTLAEWQSRRDHLRQRILFTAALDPMPPKAPLHPRSMGRSSGPGYLIENIAIETLPGLWLAGNLYKPSKPAGRLPAILHPHGHWKNGRLEHSDNCSSPSLASALARGGAIVFAYDMVGYNDTLQLPHKFGLGKTELLWNFGPLQLQTWNSIRALDYLLSRPDVDPARIGITGASGGGTQTFLLTAIDDRIRASAPVNMVSFLMQGGCECENSAGLRIGANNVEFAAMAAPRPMLLVSATGDWTRNTLEEELPAVRSVYRLYGAEDKVSAVRIDAPHNYNQQSRAAVYAFFNQRFQLKAAVDLESPPASLDSLRLLRAPDSALGPMAYEEIFAQWRLRALAAFRDALADALLARLQQVFAASIPAPDPPMRFFPGDGPPILFLGEESAAPVSSGRPVLTMQFSRAAHPLQPGPKDAQHVLAFNRSDAAQATRDILAALQALSARAPGPIEIQAPGAARWPALFAAAIAPQPVSFQASRADFCYGDDCLEREFFVPGLQYAGGVDAAFRLLKRKP